MKCIYSHCYKVCYSTHLMTHMQCFARTKSVLLYPRIVILIVLFSAIVNNDM